MTFRFMTSVSQEGLWNILSSLCGLPFILCLFVIAGCARSPDLNPDHVLRVERFMPSYRAKPDYRFVEPGEKVVVTDKAQILHICAWLSDALMHPYTYFTDRGHPTIELAPNQALIIVYNNGQVALFHHSGCFDYASRSAAVDNTRSDSHYEQKDVPCFVVYIVSDGEKYYSRVFPKALLPADWDRE